MTYEEKVRADNKAFWEYDREICIRYPDERVHTANWSLILQYKSYQEQQWLREYGLTSEDVRQLPKEIKI